MQTVGMLGVHEGQKGLTQIIAKCVPLKEKPDLTLFEIFSIAITNVNYHLPYAAELAQHIFQQA